MSLDKAIRHCKERRKPYYRAGRYDRTCRPGGGCDYCRGNRQHKHRKAEAKADATQNQEEEDRQ